MNSNRLNWSKYNNNTDDDVATLWIPFDLFSILFISEREAIH